MYEHFSRRPKEIEDAIIASWEPSKVHKNVFSKDETKELINLFKKAPKAGSGVANYKMFDDKFFHSTKIVTKIKINQVFTIKSNTLKN